MSSPRRSAGRCDWKIPNDHDAARALQSGDIGHAETRISRLSLEMASSITGRPIPQERKTDFGLRGSGRGIAQVNSGCDEPPIAPVLSPADARRTPNITWPPPDLITYGDKLTFAQLNATASIEGTLVYTPGPGYVLPAGMHTLWVTFTPADSGDLRSSAVRNFNCCGQGNAGTHLANTCRDHLWHARWTMLNSMPRRQYLEDSSTLRRRARCSLLERIRSR